MELAQIIKTLWDQRIAVVAVLLVAFLAGVSTVYRIGTDGLTKRSHQFGAAQSQILIDSPRSSLVDLTQETPPLATRAAVYTQFMRSNAVKEAISKADRHPGRADRRAGPLHDGRRLAEPPAALGGARQRGAFREARLPPRLRLPAGPSDRLDLRAGADRQVRDPARRGHRRGRADLHRATRAGAERPCDAQTQIRELGSAEGGTVNSGADPIMAVLAFVGISIAGLGGILASRRSPAASRGSRGRRPGRARAGGARRQHRARAAARDAPDRG